MEHLSSNSESLLGLASLEINMIKVGAALNSPIFDADSTPPALVLAAGTILTEGLLKQLENRSITSIRVAHQELVHLTKSPDQTDFNPSDQDNQTASSSQDPESDSPEAGSGQGTGNNSAFNPQTESNLKIETFEHRKPGNRWGCTTDSLYHQIEQFSTENYDPILTSHFKKEFLKDLHLSKQLFANVLSNKIKNADSSIGITNGNLERLKNDNDLFLNTSLSSHQYNGPWKHGLQTSMLAMSIATYLGLSESDIQELALGCLLHEIGTLRLNPKYNYTGQQLGTLEHLELTKHPGITMDTIRKWPDMPGTSCLIAYQTHERCDGSGYPNGRKGTQLHYLSKIAAVADTYITLTTDHPKLKGLLPYHAIEQILFQAKQGKFDADVVRGLLYTISLFPVGSFVEFSDSRVGRILRSNRNVYTKPVCELWFKDDPVATKSVVDLKDEPDLYILRPLKELAVPADKAQPESVLPNSVSAPKSHRKKSSAADPDFPFIDEKTSSVLETLNF